jgi:4-diphosphocytidyl-2-C-methyl-D-erythritol kinase
MGEDALVVSAPAKVNLTLEVLGRRPDAYHEVRSVVQAISLADRLTLATADSLSLHCDRADLEGPDNLAWRAAALLREATGYARGAAIRLVKRVPVAAGLGGGSSDAAAALRGLNRLWRVALPDERLRALGARLGADVPFFLGAGTCALAAGRGERLTPLPPLPRRWLVLLKPPFGLATASVFRAFPPERWSDGSRTLEWVRRVQAGSDVPPPFNDLEAVALDLAPAAVQAHDALLAAGAPLAHMSGSGPTFFALFGQVADARRVYRRLRAQGGEAYLARFTSEMARLRRAPSPPGAAAADGERRPGGEAQWV